MARIHYIISLAALSLMTACDATPEQTSNTAEKQAKDDHISEATEAKPLGALLISNAWAREAPEAGGVGGAFLTIVNGTSNGDTLVSAAADFATEVQIHESKMDNDVMVMRRVAEGVPIPSGATLELAPGGLHLMFIGLKEPLKAGETREVTLNFKQAGEKKVPLPIRSLSAGSPADDGMANPIRDMVDKDMDDMKRSSATPMKSSMDHSSH